MRLVIILLIFSVNIGYGQIDTRSKTLQFGEKEFKIDNRRNGFTLDNENNINLKEGYEWNVLLNAKYDRHLLQKLVLEVFPTNRINELQNKTSNKKPSIHLIWHINPSGEICSVTFLLQDSNVINISEFSSLEDKMKQYIKVTDFKKDDSFSKDFYTLTFRIRLSKILDGSFVK